MTREIRYTDRHGKSLSTPKRIDHGHLGRKAVFYTVMILMVPLGLLQVAAHYLDEVLDAVGTAYRPSARSGPTLASTGRITRS